mmetsp:Transcript_22831/g.81501  ORF Transcript_22831/g.81501 Transcript_22831/m.81501 type:complete len:300 (+) Transcript_22831:109-1008(+)
MFDRVSPDWKLKKVVGPPRRSNETRSLWKQFPLEFRATSCLMHSRPFKHVASRVGCLGGLAQRFESSHETACYARDDSHAWRRVRAATMHDTTYAFAHFRFTFEAAAATEAKRQAYVSAVSEWRLRHVGAVGKSDRAEFNNLNHAAGVYRANALLFTGAQPRFRDEARRVLELDCAGDRPGAASAAYTRETSGRLEDAKRRQLLRLLAVDDEAVSKKLFAGFFQKFYAQSPPTAQNGRTRRGNAGAPAADAGTRSARRRAPRKNALAHATQQARPRRALGAARRRTGDELGAGDVSAGS